MAPERAVCGTQQYGRVKSWAHPPFAGGMAALEWQRIDEAGRANV